MFTNKATFELKDNAVPIFKPKRSGLFAALKSIDKELDRLEIFELISPMDNSERSAPTV